MSDETRREEIRARLDAATPGPWHCTEGWYGIDTEPGPRGYPARVANGNNTPDTQLIANAPTDLAFLLDELSRAEAALAEAVAHLRVIYPERGDGSTMPNYEQTLAARAFLSEHPEAHHAV